MNEIIQTTQHAVSQTAMLAAQNRAEIDVQIATAKQYPRDIHAALERIKTIATIDSSTAADCFYNVQRGGGSIEGLSVRMAEIIAGAWGNMRVQMRIVGNDGKMITVQGMCHDLETNLAVCVEVKRRITDKNGRTYNEDMQVMTGNAASAIAFRNAVLKVVPKAITAKIVEDVKQVAVGKIADLTAKRKAVIDYFGTLGVSSAELFNYLGISRADEIDTEKVFVLRGLANAIKEGTTSIEEAFRANSADSQAIADKAKAAAKSKRSKVDAAMNRAMGKDAQAATVDTATGEIITASEEGGAA